MLLQRRLSILLFCIAIPLELFSASKPAVRSYESPWMQWKQEDIVPGVVMVKFNRGITIAEGSTLTSSGSLSALIARAGVASLVQAFPSILPATDQEIANGKEDVSRIYYAYLPITLDSRIAARTLSSSDDIEYAEPKRYQRVFDIPNDPLVTSQTAAFTRMNAFNGWTIGKGDSNIVIATVDGGTYWQHTDLIDNVWINSAEDINHNGHFDPGPPPSGDEDGIDQDGNGKVDDVVGWNFANNSNNPRGLSGTPGNAEHGTNTASMFGARTNNGIGMAGTSWNCRLMPVCASSATDGFIQYGYEGIVYAYQKGASVINCSWGGEGGASAFEQSIITAAAQAGALVVAAAGNGTANNGIGKNNDLVPSYPANYKGVLGVGATQSSSDARASFSNYGVTIPVYAPGVSILGATNSGGYNQTFMDGTSFSSPLVSGLAGLVKSLHSTWTPRQIATQIRVTADSIDAVNPTISGKLGRGRVNFARALTESHPGIEIISATILNQRGTNLFLPNDTVIVSLTVQNILFTTANNLAFVATPSDPSLSVIQGSANAGNLASGQQTSLSPFKFRVGALTVSKDIIIKITWNSNTNDRDAYAYKVTVFPAVPQWETQVSPTQTGLFSVKAVNANVVWAAGGNGSGSAPVVIRTTDGGNTWLSATGNLSGVDLYCINAVDANLAWVGTGNLGTNPGKIFATSDGGVTWNLQAYPGTQTPFMDGVWFVDANNGYAMGDPPGSGNNRFIVLKTTNGGATWAHTTSEPLGGTNEAGWNNSFCVTDVNHIWFGTNGTKIWRSSDGGTTWTSSPTGTTNSYAVSFKDNSNGMAGFDTGLLQLSTNGGASWSSVSSPATAMTGLSYLPNTTSAWFANITNPYRTTNNGTSWTQQTMSPFSGSIQHLNFADTSNGWAVTSGGEVLHYRPAGTNAVEPNPLSGIPTEFVLEQNYPNPFNPSTRIQFAIPAGTYGHTSLRVHDVLGKEVATLVDKELGPGSYNVTFDASRLSSGIYFYTLRSGAFVGTKKLILLK